MKKDMDLHKSTCGHRMTVCEGCDAKIRVMDTEVGLPPMPLCPVALIAVADLVLLILLQDHATTCPSTPSNCRHCSRPVPRSSAATHANAWYVHNHALLSVYFLGRCD